MCMLLVCFNWSLTRVALETVFPPTRTMRENKSKAAASKPNNVDKAVTQPTKQLPPTLSPTGMIMAKVGMLLFPVVFILSLILVGSIAGEHTHAHTHNHSLW